MTNYAQYRAILREIGYRDGHLPFYSFGDGGWCDWTAPEVLFKGEHSLTRTPYGYMPTEAVQEMLRLRGEFDRGGWWTVLAWVAVCVSMPKEGGPRLVLTAACADAFLSHPPHWGLPDGPANCH